jgi:hypothetical protein
MHELVGDDAHQGQHYSSGNFLPPWPTTGLQPSKDITLVEEAPGRWVWSGWESDPEYIAYKEGLTYQRMQAARQRLQEQPKWSTELFKESDEMVAIAQLFGAYGDLGQGFRSGQTEATRGGSQWPSDPSQEGYLGQQSAAFSPIAQSAPPKKEY